MLKMPIHTHTHTKDLINRVFELEWNFCLCDCVSFQSCITHTRKRREHHPPTSSQSCGSESGWAHLGALLGFSWGWNPVISPAKFLTGDSLHAFRLLENSVPVVDGLRYPLPWWWSLGTMLSFQSPPSGPRSEAPSVPTTASFSFIPTQAFDLPVSPSAHQPEETLCF